MTNDRSLKSWFASETAYPSWKDILALLGVFLVASALSSLIFGLMQKAGVISIGLGTFLAYLLQFVLTIAFAWTQRVRRLPRGQAGLQFGFNRVDFTVILWGVIVVVATGIVIEPVLSLLPDAFLEALSSLMGRGGWMMLTSIVLAPILEEFLFRGLVQDSLVRKYGPWRGIVFGAAVFGVVHIIPQQVINAFLIGLVLGYIYYRTRSLIPVMLIHCVNNAIAYFSWIMGGEKLVSTRQQVGNDTTYYVVYALACVVFVVAFVSMSWRIRQAELRQVASEQNPDKDALPNKVSQSTDTKPDDSDVTL